MVKVIVRHKVEDYETWKKGFDAALDFRKSSGEQSFKVFNNAEDKNEVLVYLEWDSMENAKKFMESDTLKDKMKEVGVSEKPDIYYVD